MLDNLETLTLGTFKQKYKKTLRAHFLFSLLSRSYRIRSQIQTIEVLYQKNHQQYVLTSSSFSKDGGLKFSSRHSLSMLQICSGPRAA